jgi:CubicO group peptidase (beta-lactamase class C family)
VKKVLAVLIVAVTLLAGCIRVAETTASMNPEDIAKTFFEASNSGDIERCFSLLSDDVVFSQDPPGVEMGKTQYEAALRETAPLHREHSVILPYKVDGNKVTFKANVSGDDFRILGVDSINISYELQVRDEKITSIAATPDSTDWARLMSLSSRNSTSTTAGKPPTSNSTQNPAPAVDNSSSMASYNRVIEQLMEKWGIPGGSIAVSKDGRLVLAKAYGTADRERNLPVQPESLFRIASVSKTITAVAVLKLVEEGKLDLEAKAFKLLDNLKPPSGKAVDPRIYNITIRQLLQHSAGWDGDKSFDPMFSPTKAAVEVGATQPATSDTIVRYMLGQQLDFDPGSQYAYSNFGYCVLGRIIEKVTGQSYYDYVMDNILRPAGATSMRLGKSLENERYDGEVRYYDYEGAPMALSVFPGSLIVPWPYGGFDIEAMDAHGGWIATATDLLRFVTALDGGKLIKSDSLAVMVSHPAAPLWQGSSYYYGMGWLVRPSGVSANWWHTGSLPGTYSIVVRTSNGFAWAALFNTRPKDADAFSKELDNALWDAYSGVTSWPTNDLFK